MGEVIDCTRDENGRWIVPPKTGQITSANARNMARARWDKAAAAARSGMALAVSNAAGVDVRKQSAKSWGMIVEHLTDVLLATNNARGAADLASFVGKATDMLPDKRVADATNTMGDALGLTDADDMLLVIRRGRQLDTGEE